MSVRMLGFAAALSIIVGACADETKTPEKTAATEAVVEISDLHIMAPSAGRDVAGGGMKITATGGDFRLVSASSEAAERVEMHTMEMEDDMMRMRQVEGFDIAAGETFVLEPGGPHLMLFGFDTKLQSGDTAEMLFTFEDASGDSITLNYEASITGGGHH